MYWLKLASFCLPLLGYVAIVYGAILPIEPEVKIIVAAMGFLMGGLTASAFQELERWWASLSDVYGSATFATPREVKSAGMYQKEGVLLGRHGRRLLRFDQPGHLLTLAPTRSGKGACGVIPNLLEYPGSVVTVDIKGENLAIAGRRRQAFGPVWKLAPFETESSCFNPLDFMRDGEDAWEDAAMLAEMLVVPSGSEDAAFFESEARGLLTGIILYVATEVPKDRRNMAEVRRLITLSGRELGAVVEQMRRARHPVIRRTAGSFLQMADRLKASVLAQARTHTAIWDSERVARITARSDFSLEDLKEWPASLFLVVPPEHLDVYRPLVRLILGLAVRAMIRNTNRPKHNVLFLVDEFPALGGMKPLEEGVAYLAGYSVTLWLFAQDLGQLQEVYGRERTRSIIANTNMQTFGTADADTAEMLSRMLGNETRRVRHKSKSRHSFIWPDYDRFNVGDGETGRPLLTPDEIRCLGDELELIFIRGMRPILARKVPYYSTWRYRGLWDKWQG